MRSKPIVNLQWRGLKPGSDRRCVDTEFAIGDQVWLEAFNLSTDALSKKLTAKHLGPYEVLEQIGSTAYCLSIPLTWHVHNVFHASLLSCTKEDTILGCVPTPQPIVRLAQQELWVIDQFVNSRWFRGKFQLKVRWEDQEEDQDDWRAYQTILDEAATWHQELAVEDLPEVNPTLTMINEYYDHHLGAPQHDDPPHRQAAQPCTRAVRHG